VYSDTLKKQLEEKDKNVNEMKKTIKELNDEIEQRDFEAINGGDEADIIRAEL